MAWWMDAAALVAGIAVIIFLAASARKSHNRPAHLSRSIDILATSLVSSSPSQLSQLLPTKTDQKGQMSTPGDPPAQAAPGQRRQTDQSRAAPVTDAARVASGVASGACNPNVDPATSELLGRLWTGSRHNAVSLDWMSRHAISHVFTIGASPLPMAQRFPGVQYQFWAYGANMDVFQLFHPIAGGMRRVLDQNGRAEAGDAREAFRETNRAEILPTTTTTTTTITKADELRMLMLRHRLLVQCEDGMSVAPTLVCAFLMQRFRLRVREAAVLMQSHPRQFAALGRATDTAPLLALQEILTPGLIPQARPDQTAARLV